MRRHGKAFRPGDLVEVKAPEEILATLDEAGAVDGLPFMPEMMEFCGKRFQISHRVVKTCTSGTKAGSSMRVFRDDDVFLLEGLRCSGLEHDGCQKACTIFWREAWLRRVKVTMPPPTIAAEESARLRSNLRSKQSDGIYFCQASELLKATNHLSRKERLTKCASEIRAGNCTAWQMIERTATWLAWRIRRLFLGAYGRGKNKTTPVGSLGLAAGEQVEVKTMPDISETLNEAAHNRGLWFSPDMGKLCGTKQKVEKRIERIIVDGTGEMRQLRNTVFLEGSYCGCPYVAFGGCPRKEYVYWREIWLRRSSG